MPSSQSANPAAELANGVRISEQVAATLGFQATPSVASFQGHRPHRLISAGWVVVRQNNGWRKSIPVLRWRSVPIAGSEMRR
jgi:hypothetical protein